MSGGYLLPVVFDDWKRPEFPTLSVSFVGTWDDHAGRYLLEINYEPMEIEWIVEDLHFGRND